MWCVFCKWRRVHSGPCKYRQQLHVEDLCLLSRRVPWWSFLRYINCFICVTYGFSRNKSNFPCNITSVWRGSFISSWWFFFREGEGGMIWENDILTCILSCKNWIASLCLPQDAACLGLVHGDDPERCYGEGGGRGVHVSERM